MVIVIDRDSMVSLLQTFYNQGFDDAANSPAPFDMKEAAEFQLRLLEKKQLDEMIEAEIHLRKWEHQQGLL